MIPLLIHSLGEPGGIGPELLVKLAQQPSESCRLAVADPALLQHAAELCGIALELSPYTGRRQPTAAGQLFYTQAAALSPVLQVGTAQAEHAPYILAGLDMAIELAQEKAAAIITGPINKASINEAGINFSGHTEYIADACGIDKPVMMLTSGDLRVALVTTHLPLRDVADAVTAENLRRTLQILHSDLQNKFGIAQPRILICGLNPHAGESGHLGDEEIHIMQPVIAELRQQGMQLSDPLPADTLFTPDKLENADAVLAMYHDQGLPVLKHAGFGQAVNITLGLPIIRTSVDHGTALDLAGKGVAKIGSLMAAESLAEQLCRQNKIL